MQCLSIPYRLEVPHLSGARHVRDSCLSTHEFGQREAGVLGERFHLGADFRFLTILARGDRLGDVLLQLLQLAERQCLDIEISRWCGPCPRFPSIDIPSWQSPAFPGREGQGGRMLVLAT